MDSDLTVKIRKEIYNVVNSTDFNSYGEISQNELMFICYGVLTRMKPDVTLNMKKDTYNFLYKKINEMLQFKYSSRYTDSTSELLKEALNESIAGYSFTKHGLDDKTCKEYFIENFRYESLRNKVLLVKDLVAQMNDNESNIVKEVLESSFNYNPVSATATDDYPKYFLKIDGLFVEKTLAYIERLADELDSNGNKTLLTYYVQNKPYGHLFAGHYNCDECEYGTCNISNLNVCGCCSEFEAGLTTECCGERVDRSKDHPNSDFKFGRWIVGSKDTYTERQDIIDDVEAVVASHKENPFTKQELERIIDYYKVIEKDFSLMLFDHLGFFKKFY